MISRRRLVGGAFYAMALAALGGGTRAIAMGGIPGDLGVVRHEGEASVSGKPPYEGMPVGAGDALRTGQGGMMVFVIGRDAFLMRQNTSVVIPMEENLKSGRTRLSHMRIEQGGLLAVFEPGGRPRRVSMPMTVAAVRGTALYAETLGERDYLCACYGIVEIRAALHEGTIETVRTRKHDSPRYIYGAGARAPIETAPMLNHTDEELTMLEALVGRKPPFEPGGDNPYKAF